MNIPCGAVYQRHAGGDAKLLIKFHWPNTLVCSAYIAICLMCVVHLAIFTYDI